MIPPPFPPPSTPPPREPVQARPPVGPSPQGLKADTGEVGGAASWGKRGAGPRLQAVRAGESRAELASLASSLVAGFQAPARPPCSRLSLPFLLLPAPAPIAAPDRAPPLPLAFGEPPRRAGPMSGRL